MPSGRETTLIYCADERGVYGSNDELNNEAKRRYLSESNATIESVQGRDWLDVIIPVAFPSFSATRTSYMDPCLQASKSLV